VYSSFWNSISELQGVTCHTGSHTDITYPPTKPAQSQLSFSDT